MKKKSCVAIGILMLLSLCFSHYTYSISLEDLPFLATITDEIIYDFVINTPFGINKKDIYSFDKEMGFICTYDEGKNIVECPIQNLSSKTNDTISLQFNSDGKLVSILYFQAIDSIYSSFYKLKYDHFIKYFNDKFMLTPSKLGDTAFLWTNSSESAIFSSNNLNDIDNITIFRTKYR
ncbi:MAG: hypothetical protein LBP92_09030 [Deltaproteobacteria bacterium]|jgi:hypothetical protein|nr:hypothetical protein [Deltaproteobacteria bacterium]